VLPERAKSLWSERPLREYLYIQGHNFDLLNQIEKLFPSLVGLVQKIPYLAGILVAQDENSSPANNILSACGNHDFRRAQNG